MSRADLSGVQSLVLRPPCGPSVAHLLMRVAPGQGGLALRLLQRLLEDTDLSTGAQRPRPGQVQCSLGFTWRGLQQLNLPDAYLQALARLAPAFTQGAPLRAARLGDSGASAPRHWHPDFALDAAHVLLTLHGPDVALTRLLDRFASNADAAAREAQAPRALSWATAWRGQRLGAPPGRHGQWVHFGYRDGLTAVGPVSVPVPQARPQLYQAHADGEFLLGHADDTGANRFALPGATAQLRAFFRDSSFGVFRPLRQDVDGFETFLHDKQQQLERHVSNLHPEWLRAQLCGRWPGGAALRPGAQAPGTDTPGPAELAPDFGNDRDGRGCPFGAHVRRMNPDPAQTAGARLRPLIRRGTPWGPALWHDADPAAERGLLGLFFCASLEDQFEHLLGEWANRMPLGAAAGSEGLAAAKDPLIGQHENPQAALAITLPDGTRWHLDGLQPWTRCLGTAYAWHPGAHALQQLLSQQHAEREPWP